mgnify:CR=1 FL=1
MNRILLVIVVILLAGSAWFGVEWLTLKRLHGSMVQEAKAAMVVGMSDLQDRLAAGIDSLGDDAGADAIIWSDLNAGIGTVLTSAQILKESYKSARHETDVLHSIRWTMTSLQRFVRQAMQFGEDHQPFAINSCEGRIIANAADIRTELQKYRNLLTWSGPENLKETDEIWSLIVERWNPEEAAHVHRCGIS